MLLRRILIIAVLAGLVAVSYRIYAQSRPTTPVTDDKPAGVYYNLLHEIQFNLPNGYQPEDISYPYGVALFQNISDEFKKSKSESDFLNSGGIYIKAMRQIPGAKEVFQKFISDDFEVKLRELGKTSTGEFFVTNEGYDAYKTKVTSPTDEIHIVINTPTAYWLTAKQESDEYRHIYQSFKQLKLDELVDLKKSISLFESFMKDLSGGQYEQAANKMSDVLRGKFPVDNLRFTFTPENERLNQPLRVFSVQSDGQLIKLRGTLENKDQNRYSFVSANLIRSADNWLVDLFVINEESQGLPYENAFQNVKKEVKKEDLLK